MDVVYYCGFNGFKQVPSCDSHTINTLVAHGGNPRADVRDAAICWNYLVIVDDDGVTKHGLVGGGKNGSERLGAPPGGGGGSDVGGAEAGGKVVGLSATPRHILACTENGECWTHEEVKGWRKVQVGAERPAEDDQKKDSLLDLNSPPAPPDNDETPLRMVKTACGDSHNLALDANGQAYSLPSPLDFDAFPGGGARHKVSDVACGKEHCLLLTEHGQVFSWGGGSRGQLGHGTLNNEDKPRLVSSLDGMRVRTIAAGGWHSAVISQFDDLYMFGWNESGQLAQTTNLVKPAECFAAVEKLLMACCTMQPEDTANPTGDSEDCEVYSKNDGGGDSPLDPLDVEKDALTCYNAATSCNDAPSDLIVVQNVPMLVQIPGGEAAKALDVSCGSRHTVVLTGGNQLWGFGWNKYGQLGLGHNLTRDAMERITLPKAVGKNSVVKMLRCGDWGTILVTTNKSH